MPLTDLIKKFKNDTQTFEIRPPEIVWNEASGNIFKPSWHYKSEFINEEHARIWHTTKDLPGWQDVPDSLKLYEMAYFNGASILEIGVYGGRSAIVELRGALAANGCQPQYYGLDIDPQFLSRTLPIIKHAKLEDHCFFYHGDLQQFRKICPIVPSMVFVDGSHEYDGVTLDLKTLATMLAPGTPVYCHDYLLSGVKKAIHEAVDSSFYEMIGLFAGSVLLRSTKKCRGKVLSLIHI